ncbi:MAG: hypothetical protein ACLQNE_18555 [Thermoguttaceae bacterium]
MPDDISQWSTNEHFFKARWEGHPKLKDAVDQKAKQCAREGNSAKIEEASVLLAKLLKAEQTPPPGTPAATSSTGSAGGNSSSPGPGMMPGMMPGSGSPGPGMRPGGMPSVPGGTGPGMMPGMMPGSGSMPGAGQSAALGHAKPLAPEVIATIVEDLTLLGGQTAKQSLKDLITASLKTDDDRAALQAVFQVVAKDTASAESQELLYVMLTAPELLRPEPAASQSGSSGGPGSSGYGGMPGSPRMSSPGGPGFGPGGYGGNSQGRVTAADLQAMALTVVGQTASEEFRKRLAEFVAKKTSPYASRKLLGDYLMKPDPRNLAAQIVIYDGQTKEAQAWLADQFTSYSSAALALLLGVPPRLKPSSAVSGNRGFMQPGNMGSAMGSGMAPGSGYGSTPAMGYSPIEGAQSQTGGGMGSGAMGGGPSMPGMGMASRPMGGGASMPGMGMGGQTGAASGPTTALAALTLLLGENGKTLAGDLPYRIAGNLWGPAFTPLVNSRLADVESLQAATGSILLASTVPTDATRAKLQQLLHDHYDEGPEALEAAGFATRVLNDPGFLLVLKSQKHDVPKPKIIKPKREGNGPQGKPNQGGMPNRGGMSNPGGGPGQMGQEHSIEARWMLFCETMAHAFGDQFASAGKDKTSSKELADKRPFEMLPRAESAAEYDFDWPEGVGDKSKLTGVPLDPMTIHYVKFHLEREVAPSWVLGRYKKLRRSVEHTLESGYWLESYAMNPETGRRLSIDVLVEKRGAARRDASKTGNQPFGMSGPGAPGGFSPSGHSPGQPGEYKRVPGQKSERDTPAELVIEILSIETNSPDGGKPKSAATEREEK